VLPESLHGLTCDRGVRPTRSARASPLSCHRLHGAIFAPFLLPTP
jgi:hypothetical protein